MVRANLGQLLGNLGETTTPIVVNAEPRTAPKQTAAAPPKTKPKPTRAKPGVTKVIEKQNADSTVEDTHTPAYLRFVRKEMGCCVIFGQRIDGFSYAARAGCW